VAAPAVAVADARLTVGGLVGVGETTVDVDVVLTNSGDTAGGTVVVTGELGESQDTGKLEAALAPGKSATVPLQFPRGLLTPGLHAVDLLLEYTDVVPGGTTPVTQRAFLLVGTAQPERVRLRVPDLSLDTFADLRVEVQSADGAPHRVRVHVSVPHGLQAPDPPAMVALPASGAVEVPIRLLRSGAPRPTRLGVVALAETDEHGLAGASVATGVVSVEPDPAVLPRLRRPLAVIAGVLLGAAALIEALSQARRRWGASPSQP
jgi:hypothetical protein